MIKQGLGQSDLSCSVICLHVVGSITYYTPPHFALQHYDIECCFGRGTPCRVTFRHSEFIERQGYTAEDFYERLREALERDPWCHEAVFAKIMTATADFDIFMNMMREAAEALPPKQSCREDGEESAGEQKGDRRSSTK